MTCILQVMESNSLELNFDRHMIKVTELDALQRQTTSDRRLGTARAIDALRGNAMMCPSMMALAVALVPGEVNAEEARLGHGVTLAAALLMAVLVRLAFDVV